MSHERDAIAHAFSRPFIEPPKRASAKRIGFTLAGIALLAAGLIASQRQSDGPSNGLECSTTSTFSDSTVDGGKPRPSMSGTFRIEFVPGNMARLRFGAGVLFDSTLPVKTTGGVYTIGDDPNSYIIIDRESGELRKDNYASDRGGWVRTTITGSCHPIHIDANM